MGRRNLLAQFKATRKMIIFIGFYPKFVTPTLSLNCLHKGVAREKNRWSLLTNKMSLLSAHKVYI